MRVSVTPKVFSVESQAIEVPDLFAWLQANKTAAPKDDSPLWSPTLFGHASRKAEHAQSVGALVFDFDDGRPDLPLVRATGLAHLWHTTHTGANRWRLVIPLSEPVQAPMWGSFWTRAVSALQITRHDTACANVGRFYYVPPATAAFELNEGRTLPADELLGYTEVSDDLKALRDTLLKAGSTTWKPAIRLALSGVPIATEGSRDNSVTGLGFYLGRSVVGVETQTDAVYRVLERGLVLPGREPKDHWEKKFKDAFERGRAKRQELAAQNRKGLRLDEPWAQALQTIPRLDGSTSIISNTYNASIILANEGSWRFQKNLLEDTIEYAEPGEEFRTMLDPDATRITNWLQREFRLTISRQQLQDQCEALASPFDPLANYINRLQWDGVVRAPLFLSEYFGCDDGPVTRLYSKKWLISLVARALRPGCKVDTVLVLQGAQGLGKSTGLRLLTEPWFSDSRLIIGDKDSLLAASRFWLHELGELASLKRADLATMNAFITSPVDSYRPPYGRSTVQRPRRCLYVATTNESEFLTDPTGARRFWVVSVTKPIDFGKIQADRDQLVAEAAYAYRHGEHWWLETSEERLLQRESASDYQIEDNSARKDAIIKWWAARPFDKRPEDLTCADVVTEIWNIPLERITKAQELEAARALQELGFLKMRRNRAGDRRRAFRPGVQFLQMPQRNGASVVDLKDVSVG